MSAITYQITGVSIVWSTVYEDAHQIKDQSSASLAFVRGTHTVSKVVSCFLETYHFPANTP